MTTNEIVGFVAAFFGILGNIAQYYLNRRASNKEEYEAVKDGVWEMYHATRAELKELKEQLDEMESINKTTE